MVKTEKEVIQLGKETAIPILKSQLKLKLTQLIDDSSDRAEFVKFCNRVEYIIRAWYHLRFEDLMQLYSLFDPHTGSKKLEQENLSPQELDILEQNFLHYLFQVMDKSNFKMATDEDIEIASGKYLLDLPIIVDDSKLDKELLRKYFDQQSDVKAPSYADKFIIFRRGIGIDHMTGYFIVEKMDILIARLGTFLSSLIRLENLWPERSSGKPKEELKKNKLTNFQSDQDNLPLERIRLENMGISISKLLSKTTIQEPTFERIIVVYRKASTTTTKERGIYVKHFQKIPLADMEIVLPEKKIPGLTPVDWVWFLATAVIGLVAAASSINAHKADTWFIWVIFAVLFQMLGSCAKIYFSYQQNVAAYQNLITKLVYEKQLDSGRGTLLHLCDNVIQQEVKEVIISFFTLMKCGKCSVKDLDKHCEQLIEEKFGEKCNFDVDDAVQKLKKLGIVEEDSNGQYSCVALKQANDIIGITTEELVLTKQEPGRP